MQRLHARSSPHGSQTSARLDPDSASEPLRTQPVPSAVQALRLALAVHLAVRAPSNAKESQASFVAAALRLVV
jgi:hypothetical protein